MTATRASAARIAALAAPVSAKTVLLACLNVRGGPLVMTLPGAAALSFGEGARPVALNVRDWAFARRLLRDGDIGFAEGYMAGEWDTSDLPALLAFFAENAERIGRVFTGGVLGRLRHLMRHMLRANTRAGARRNIFEHYDLGNRFYAAWLDSTMTYSAARFDGRARALEDAQHAKYHALARHLDLQRGDRVLEIGCGWGGFAEVAARDYGANITGLTISQAQLDYARDRIARAGLSDRVELRLQDYRDVEGRFDKVASIEMFEAVGEAYWPTYFQKIADVLKPGGAAALQIITIRDDLFAAYRRRVDFIQRYIFPGGMLPSAARLREEAARAGLAWRKAEAFGLSYAETLAEWARRFTAKWDEIRPLGFDEQFKKLWRFYLGYCEAGFRTGRTDVIQLSLVKGTAGSAVEAPGAPA